MSYTDLTKLHDLLADPAWEPVRAWVSKLAPVTQTRSPYVIRRFCQFTRKSPAELLEWQERCLKSTDRREQREVLRQVQAYLDSHEGTFGYKAREYADLRSLFAYHDLPLAQDRQYRIRATRPMNVGTMTTEDLQAILTEARVRQDYAMHSMILTQFQSFSGVAEICHINRECGQQTIKQLRDNIHPVRIDMLRIRKGNPKPWYTFIGNDAAEALKEYFDKNRGDIKPGEPIWRDKNGGIMTDKSYRYKFQALARHVKAVPKAGKDRSLRYGKSPHELRDLAKSLVHKAHSQKHEINNQELTFDGACSEFFMGHTIDRLGYDQFWKHDPDGVRHQYLIAEKYLNILSNPPGQKLSRGRLTAADIADAIRQDPELIYQAVMSSKTILEGDKT